MAKAAKKTKAAARSTSTGSIFDHFSAHHPGHEFAQLNEEPAQRAPSGSPDYAAELADLRRQNEELNRRLNAPVIPRAQAPARQAIDPAALRFSTAGLPDPTMEPEKYNAELQTRVNAAIEANVHSVQQVGQQQAGMNQQAQTLWTQFAGQYPQWADDLDKVRFAAETVIAEAKAKGLDTELYISTYADTFCSDVNKKMVSVFGDPLESEGEDDDVDLSSDGTLDEPELPDDDGRTAGIFGGVESGGRPEGRKAAPAGDMIKDLQDIQRKSGFF